MVACADYRATQKQQEPLQFNLFRRLPCLHDHVPGSGRCNLVLVLKKSWPIVEPSSEKNRAIRRQASLIFQRRNIILNICLLLTNS